MDPSRWLRRSKSNSISLLLAEKGEYVLPLPVPDERKIKIRTLLGHCLYRRAVIWIFAFSFLLSLTLFGRNIHAKNGRIIDLVDFRKGSGGTAVVESTPVEEEEKSEDVHWLKYKHLDGYFSGLKALVPAADHTPEFPRPDKTKSPFPLTVSYTGLPTPTPFVPQPDYKSSDYIKEYEEVKTCYLDEDQKVPAPDLYAYNGVVQGMPDPVLGSHKVLGIRDDVCFDRFGRYGPYGLGYELEKGGTHEGLDTERSGSEEVWSKTGKIDYRTVDWGKAQERCFQANKKRFVDIDANNELGTENSDTRLDEEAKWELKSRRSNSGEASEKPQAFLSASSSSQKSKPPASKKKQLERTAVVIRTYVGFQWTYHAILNFRALISELALRSGGEYSVHFLLHVRDDDAPVWADAETAQRILDDNVPTEFHGLCTLWSEAQMRLLYPGRFGVPFDNPSNQDVHGVYRSAHMPLQYFALENPQYAHFWNWEMDMRWLGDYYELFDRLGAWARQQSRTEMWERSQKYYIPHVHGSWENFTALVHNETEASGRRAIMGPVLFAGKQPLRSERRGRSFLPASCARGEDPQRCGVGEDADLITLNPIFDVEESGWVFARDATGYERSFAPPPRRCAIVTAGRLSRRLLAAMHEETWSLHHSMFSEMFPASVALHRGLKAVYAPHPLLIDREWELAAVDASFNGGRDHSASGSGSPFDFANEHNHAGTSWYYNSEFAGLLWRRWLGYAQWDGRGDNGGRSGEGTLRGGREEEESDQGTGRLCLRSMLVHPIKWENPRERG